MPPLTQHLKSFFTQILRQRRAQLLSVILAVVLAKGASMALPWQVGQMIDALAHQPTDSSAVSLLLAKFVGTFILAFAMGIFQNWLLSRFVQSVIYDTAKIWLRTIFRKDFSFFAQIAVGQLVKSTDRGLIAHEKLLHFLCYSSLPILTELIWTSILVFSIAGAKLAMWIFLPLILQNFVARRIIFLRRQQIENVNLAEDSLSGELSELLSNGQSIKLENRIDFVLSKMDKYLSNYAGAARSLSVSGSLLSYLHPTMGYLIISMLVYFANHDSGLLSVGSFVCLITYGSRMAGAHGDFLESLRNFSQFIADISGFLKTLNEAEFDRPAKLPSKNTLSPKVQLRLNPFSVIKGKANLSICAALTIPPGQKVAIMGPSGGGKTTLLEALAGMSAEARVALDVNTVPLERISSKHQLEILRYNPQRPSLLSGSIAEGVFFQAQLSAVQSQTLRQLNLSNFIEPNLRQIHERATNLSGGEARRLALARALARPGAVNLLDEPTSAVNGAMAVQIWDSIFETTRTRTLIVVTHDAKEIHRFDRVLLIKDGKVLADQTPAEIELNPDFKKMAEAFIDAI